MTPDIKFSGYGSARVALFFLAAALAWAPFPLGSAVTWGAPLLALLIAAAWILWGIGAAFAPGEIMRAALFVRIPILLFLVFLVWCGLQLAPLGWAANPMWQNAAALLHADNITGRITINTWHTQTQFLYLLSLLAAGWIAYCVCRQADNAIFLLRCVAWICGAYVLYGISLRLLGTSQAALIYQMPVPRAYIAGPFMLHNSFATYCGLGALAGLLLLFQEGKAAIVWNRSRRAFFLSLLQFCSGRGLVPLICFLLAMAGLVASASRGGFLAAMAGLAAVIILLTLRAHIHRASGYVISLATALVVLVLAFVVVNGDSLLSRLALFASGDLSQTMRLVLWQTCIRMIEVFPWTGTGLGTFRDAYPAFAPQVFPYVMDRAHNDYLELMAGVGIPAALLWLLALAWLAVICLRGALRRRRHYIFPTIGFAASVLVAAHSLVDFSLQIPAVGLFYAVLLGMGTAQAQRRHT